MCKVSAHVLVYCFFSFKCHRIANMNEGPVCQSASDPTIQRPSDHSDSITVFG